MLSHNDANLVADVEASNLCLLQRIKAQRREPPKTFIPSVAQGSAIKPQIAVKPVPVISQEDLRVIPGFEARGIDKVVADKPAPKAKKKAIPAIPQEEEIERFFKLIVSLRDRAIFRLMYHGGLRASEIGLLEIRNYQPRTDRLMVTRLKGSNSGEHSLNRKESKDLKAWLKVRGMLPGAIFPSRKGGPISRKALAGQ